MPSRSTLIILLMLGILASGSQAEQVRFSMTSDGHPSNFDGFDITLNAMTQIPGGPGTFMVSAGDNEEVSVSHAMITATFGANCGWYPVVGNHETGESHQYLDNYDYGAQGNGPVNFGPAGAQNTIYSFDAGPVHIVALNEYWDGTNNPNAPEALYYPTIVPQTMTWLQNDLANNDKPWTLVVGHPHAHPQPDEDWGDDFSWSDTGLNRYPQNRDLFWQTLEDYDVTAYVHGHTHRFSHTIPKPDSRVWEIDDGQACGPTGGMDPTHYMTTFLTVEADENQLVFEVWRDLNGDGVFAVTDLFAARGDINEDGFVGGDDLTEILTHWGESGMSRQDGDLNNDGFIGGDDYTEALTYWGTGRAPQPLTTAIPEPTTLSRLLLGGLVLLRRRR